MNQQQKMATWGKTSGGNSATRRWRYRHQPANQHLQIGLSLAKIGKKAAKRLEREQLGKGLSLLKKADAQNKHVTLTAKKPGWFERFLNLVCSFRRGGENYAG